MDAIYRDILIYVKEKTGINFLAYKYAMLERRINIRVIKTNSESTEAYFSYLKANEPELEKLKYNFFIHVSRFFRDPIVFEFFSHKILPDYFDKINRNNRPLRVWSAGCASGEEPYSVAIILNSFFEKENINPDVFFFATDMDQTILNKAREGIYNTDSVEDIKLKDINKYFKRNNSSYEISDKIKSMVHFSQDNLLDRSCFAPKESIFGSFDFIFCRNVLIYFNKDYCELIVDKLDKSLSSGGYLFLGEAEMLSNYKSKFLAVSDCFNIYKKIG